MTQKIYKMTGRGNRPVAKATSRRAWRVIGFSGGYEGMVDLPRVIRPFIGHP